MEKDIPAINDDIWDYVDDSRIATTTINTVLLPGDSTVVSIQAEIQACDEADAWLNIAEISSATDEQNNPMQAHLG